MGHFTARRRAVSLIEIVIVVVILGILAAIAIPRMTWAGQTAAENALAGDMAVWRSALDLYQSEHGGAYPKDNTTLAAQLTQYTDDAGETSSRKDARFCHGPYMRSVPALPMIDPGEGAGVPRGSTTIGPALLGGAPSTLVGGGAGWLYDGAGNVYPNTGSLSGPAGKLYNGY